MARLHATALAVFALIATVASSGSGAPVATAASPDEVCVETNEPGTHALSARGGDELREPELNEPTLALPVAAKGKGSSKFRTTIPVYFHVVAADDGTGNVSQEDIDNQIAVMNQGFRGRLGGADSGINWVLAGVTRTTNSEWYNAGPGSPAERAMKKALTRGAPEALNYYSTTAGLYLGWAYLPGLTPSRMFLDGIVVDWESMVKTSTRYQDRFDLGYTAIHEAGHWLGLEHTFWGGCNAKGDYVDDTPAMKVPTSGCPIGKDTCPEPGLDPIHNFMDYSFDSCYFEFTRGQNLRMQDHFLFFRAG